jgi:galactokinase/mevalonate kinase-like predicted kinase
MSNFVSYSAPGRCGVIGNPSDIYGGAVISCSLPVRNQARVSSEPGSNPIDPTLWNVAKARIAPGFAGQVQWESQVPRSSGLAGSTALLAATMAALAECVGRSLGSSAELAEAVRDAEMHEANVVCGFQDAYMVVEGGLRQLTFAGKSPDEVGPPAVRETLDLPLPFLLITTGVERLSGSVHGPMVERWRHGEWAVVEGMREIADLVPPAREAWERQDYGALAQAMALNHRIVADLGGSGEAIEALIAACVRHGARAAKLAGAGLGGTVIALTEDADLLAKRLRKDGYTRFLRPEIAPGLRRESPG